MDTPGSFQNWMAGIMPVSLMISRQWVCEGDKCNSLLVWTWATMEFSVPTSFLKRIKEFQVYLKSPFVVSDLVKFYDISNILLFISFWIQNLHYISSFLFSLWSKIEYYHGKPLRKTIHILSYREKRQYKFIKLFSFRLGFVEI